MGDWACLSRAPHSFLRPFILSSKRIKVKSFYCNASVKIPLDNETVLLQSLEFLKKSWNLPSNFPDLEKVWKIEIKSWKMVKSLEFGKLQQVLYSEFFLSCSSWKKLRSCIFSRSPLITYLMTLSLENYCFGKSLETVLNFGSKNLYKP